MNISQNQPTGSTFSIYQLKGDVPPVYRFASYDCLQEKGLTVDPANYDLIYTAPLDADTTLEDIYRKFNIDRPQDFTGHSLSVSDIVVLTRDGHPTAHYCDRIGFREVPGWTIGAGYMGEEVNVRDRAAIFKRPFIF